MRNFLTKPAPSELCSTKTHWGLFCSQFSSGLAEVKDTTVRTPCPYQTETWSRATQLQGAFHSVKTTRSPHASDQNSDQKHPQETSIYPNSLSGGERPRSYRNHPNLLVLTWDFFL